MSGPDVEGLPWPEGEPGALTGAAGRLQGIAGRLSAAGAPLSAAAGIAGWTGGASLASSVLLSAQAQSVSGAAEVFGSTAVALRGLATVLSDGQDEVKSLAREVKAAREAAESARARANEAAGDPRMEATFLHLSANAGQAEQHYREVRARAEKEAAEIVRQCKAADAATAGEVAEAKVAATAGPGGLPAGMSDVDIQPVALAWKYAPHLRFHPDEQHLPADLAAALRRGNLVFRDGRWYVDLPDGDRALGGTDAPIDFTVVERDGKRYLMYRVWYPYNDKTAFGDHEGDLELFGVELGEDGRPDAALYYGHGTPHRVPWDEVEREGGHPVSYVGSGSHAAYPESGHYPIADGFATDQAADGGPRQDTEHTLRERDRDYRYPPGTRLGEDDNSPSVPDTGGNVEPFPAGSTPIDGKPERGDGVDGTVSEVLEAGAGPITIGQDAIGLLP